MVLGQRGGDLARGGEGNGRGREVGGSKKHFGPLARVDGVRPSRGASGGGRGQRVHRVLARGQSPWQARRRSGGVRRRRRRRRRRRGRAESLHTWLPRETVAVGDGRELPPGEVMDDGDTKAVAENVDHGPEAVPARRGGRGGKEGGQGGQGHMQAQQKG